MNKIVKGIWSRNREKDGEEEREFEER